MSKLLGNAFIERQLNYAPPGFFAIKLPILKMQKIHHKTLKVMYQSDISYDNILQLSNRVLLYQRDLRLLQTKIYKITVTLNPQFLCLYFKYRKVPYNLRSLHFCGSLILSKLPNLVKCSKSISEFRILSIKSEILTVGV